MTNRVMYICWKVLLLVMIYALVMADCFWCCQIVPALHSIRAIWLELPRTDTSCFSMKTNSRGALSCSVSLDSCRQSWKFPSLFLKTAYDWCWRTVFFSLLYYILFYFSVKWPFILPFGLYLEYLSCNHHKMTNNCTISSIHKLSVQHKLNP